MQQFLHIFQLRKLTHTSAYYLLKNLNLLNCIRRFVHSNECSNSTKFVWALQASLYEGTPPDPEQINSHKASSFQSPVALFSPSAFENRNDEVWLENVNTAIRGPEGPDVVVPMVACINVLHPMEYQ